MRELKIDPLARQALVHLRVSIKPIIHTTSLLLIQHNLEDLAPVLARAGALTDDLDRVDQIAEYGVVDGRQRAGARTLLRLRGAAAVAALGAGQDAAGGDDEDVAVGELLFEFTGEAVVSHH